MNRCCIIIVTVVTLLGFSPIAANAQVTASDAKCRATISKAGSKYVKTAQKAVIGCHKLRDGGKIGAGTNCNDLSEADLKGKVATTAQKTHDAIVSASACGTSVLAQFGRCPAPFETIEDGGATTGIDDYSELSDCLLAHADKLVEDSADRVLGSPSAPLASDVLKCHGALAKGYAKLVDRTVKERAKCQATSDKTGGPYSYFGCATSDPKGKIQATRDKAAAAITKACSVLTPLSRSARGARGAFPDLGSCAETVDGVIVCALDETAKTAGGGTAAMLWELPGICPGSGSYVVIPTASGTELDTGYTGLVHDMDPVLGYRGAAFTITCDADCGSCASSTVAPPADACRCNGDTSVGCTTDPDCAGFGGSCQCFYGPPAPFNAGGTPACVTTRVDGTMSGSLDPATGAIDLHVPLRVNIYIGIAQAQPCPLCDADTGTCDGGARNGLACTVDATDATFGSVSYDCPPSFGANITGVGLKTTVDYTTGSASLPFGTNCGGFLGAFDCACAVCSLDPSITCNSDSECALFGAGTCTASGGAGGQRRPNNCDDLTCSPDLGAGLGEGTCLAGPVDKYCNGFVRSNGEGILPCIDDADCDAYGPCPGGVSCGTCTLSKSRECFLDPIEAEGVPGAAIVGIGCVGATSNVAVNTAAGFPGAYRVKQKLSAELLCSDGVTAYEPPGGSNCP